MSKPPSIEAAGHFVPTAQRLKNPSASRLPWGRFFSWATLVCLADQASKYLVIAHLTDAFGPDAKTLSVWQRVQSFWSTAHPSEQRVFAVWPHYWHFRYVENPGAAWGLLSRSGWSLRTPFFLGVSLLAMVFLLQTFRQSQARERRLRFSLALVMGGALGNFIDRLRLGYVIDFVDWHIGEHYRWPTFNLADAAITVGVLLLLLDLGRTQQKGV